MFDFAPRWKEELVVTGPGGAFILELPMGQLSAYLPAEEVWGAVAPKWAVDLWPVLKVELEAWCAEHRADFVIDPTATVSTDYATRAEQDQSTRGWWWLFPPIVLLLTGCAVWLLRR